MSEASASVASSVANASRVRWANVSLWAAQGLLGVTFAASGAVKVFATDWFMAMDPGAWPADVPRSVLSLIGIAELAGVLGLVLPRLTGIQPRLTVFAALGLPAIMVFATGFHASRGEWVRSGLQQEFRALRRLGPHDGQPPQAVADRYVMLLHEAELLGVEFQGLVLVVDLHACHDDSQL